VVSQGQDRDGDRHVTGRNPGFSAGFDREDHAAAILLTHEYKKGDLLIIDDRASWHKVGFDYDHSQHRRLYRMLVRGDRPY
jgi:alpha-ketoglutarate-dependent taurine dioxygenase